MTARTIILFALGAVAAAAAQAGEGPVDPYTAYVAAEDAYARCGPSSEHYRTDALPPGSEVEVYLETSTGWLGIRPPESSFSWIPAALVELNSDGVTGEVLRDKTPAWVGTNLGKARQYRWQLQLAAGESVTILGENRRHGSESSNALWYRIVPPPGEFRWIHRDEVVLSRSEYRERQREQQLAQVRNAKRNPPASAGRRSPEREETAPAPQGEDQPEDAAESRRQRLADHDRPVARPQDDPPPAPPETARSSRAGGEIARAHAEDAGLQPAAAPRLEPVGSGVHQAAGWDAPKPTAGPAVTRADVAVTSGVRVGPIDTPATRTADRRSDGRWAAAPTAAGAPLPESPPKPGRFDEAGRAAEADIAGLQLLLAEALAASARASDLDPLRRRAQWWIEHEEDAVERGRARLLVERIDRYQDIARRRDGEPASPESSGPVAVVDDESGLTSVYDRSGYLVQVYSARPDAPPYALNDQEGRTVAYVSPAPGINLRRYLNQEVGLYGRTGYLTGLDTPHLVAERIVRLNR